MPPGTSGLGPLVNRPQNWRASRRSRKALDFSRGSFTRRLLAGLVAALALWAVGPTWAAGPVRLYQAKIARCTNAAGGAALFSSGARRAQVRVQNLGNATVWVGQQDGTLSTTTGWPIHAASISASAAHVLVLTGTAAGLNCVTDSANSIEIGVLEEIE